MYCVKVGFDYSNKNLKKLWLKYGINLFLSNLIIYIEGVQDYKTSPNQALSILLICHLYYIIQLFARFRMVQQHICITVGKGSKENIIYTYFMKDSTPKVLFYTFLSSYHVGQNLNP